MSFGHIRRQSDSCRREEREIQQEMEEGERVKEYAEDMSKNKGTWVKCVNPAVTDELRAHTSMFAPKTNPNYHVMLPQARDQIVEWVMIDRSWYERSDGPVVQEQQPLAEEDTTGGDEDGGLEASPDVTIQAPYTGDGVGSNPGGCEENTMPE